MGIERKLMSERDSLSFAEQRDRYLIKRKLRKGPCDTALISVMRESRITHMVAWDPDYRTILCQDPLYRKSWEWDALTVGVRMEEIGNLIKCANMEVSESKEVLEKLANDVKALSSVIEPALLDHIKGIRSARMAAVTEINQSLQALRDIRKFFLESDYQTEMERLERFVKICREINELKQTGILDVICDASIRLAIKEESEK